MTTSNKNFKVKNGLEVLGTSATVNGNEILTIASSIAALADVDLTGAVAGNSLVFDSSLNLIPGEGAGSGAAKYYVSDTKPLNPEEGIVWYNSTTGETFIYIVDEDSSQFVEVGTFGPAGATGPQGPAGADGADSTVPGPQGEQGESGIVAQPDPPEDTTVLWYDTDAPGYGIPLGGTSGQVLSKVDSEDFNTEWTTPYSQSNANSDLENLQSDIVDGAPLNLNTIGKLATSIGEDPDFIGTVNDSIDLKADIGHVHAISSITNLQAELNSKAAASHDHNNLYYTKTQSDTALSEKSDVGHTHDDRYYTETETDAAISSAISGLVDSAPSTLNTLNELAAALNDDESFASTVTTALAGKSDTSHTHDDRYYTETETDTLLASKSNTGHNHDERYYTETEVNAALAALVPSGTVIQSARATAPTGYLLCNGAAISRTTFADLFSAIGTSYGAGDGSTTFNLPNMQGRVPVGIDATQSEFDTLGETGGAKTHTLTENELAQHYHAIYTKNDDFNSTSGGTAVGPTFHNAVDGTTALNRFTNIVRQMTTVGGTDVTGGQPHNNLQPYIVMNYMIKI